MTAAKKIKDIPVPELFAWMDEALTSPESANKLLAHLNSRPNIRDTLSEAENQDFDVRWQRVWRRVSGQMPFLISINSRIE